MDSAKKAFIDLLIDSNILKWGKFTLKSGRVSPYFFNAGLFYTGDALKSVGEHYARLLTTNHISNALHLFGPAYKGLPLATATAIALSNQNISCEVSFNRKEAKAHGEGGSLIGAPLQDKDVIMIDDVITAGTAFRESKTMIEAHGGTLKAVAIALDRQEISQGSTSAVQEISELGIKVYSIINLTDLLFYLEEQGSTEQLGLMSEYQQQYGSNHE